ncbi:hypothetical protein F5Y03DRAFT_388107 [Xylaria venustula]|nr:hypothetical protein F5Y03DRAFT_388107 [Xylaria venustula]
MGNSNSTPSALPTPTHLSNSYTSSLSAQTSHSFTVSPLEPSSFVSTIKTSSKIFPHGPGSTGPREYCTWDWELDTISCTFWTITVPTPTPRPLPTPTGRYGTSEVNFSFPSFTCTDLLCIDSVASKYGFSLCLATSLTTNFGRPTPTISWPDESTTYESPTPTLTCDPVLDWKNCPSPTLEVTDSITDEWPTVVWPTQSSDYPTETSSDYDVTETSTTSSPSTEDCEYGFDCFTSTQYTVEDSRQTPSATTSTKHSYSYRSATTKRSTTSTTSTTSECDFWWDDCTPDVPLEPTTWEWGPDPWSDHTVSTTITPGPHKTASEKK